jgi:hypothetical protein
MITATPAYGAQSPLVASSLTWFGAAWRDRPLRTGHDRHRAARRIANANGSDRPVRELEPGDEQQDAPGHQDGMTKGVDRRPSSWSSIDTIGGCPGSRCDRAPDAASIRARQSAALAPRQSASAPIGQPSTAAGPAHPETIVSIATIAPVQKKDPRALATVSAASCNRPSRWSS